VEVAEPIKTAEEPVVVQLKQAPIMAIQPTGEAVEIAAVVTPPPAAEIQPDPAPAPTQVAALELPQTASWLPLIALFGLLALVGGLALRLVQKRVL
jgi:LPXTG-motif cell wall-anchored protein